MEVAVMSNEEIVVRIQGGETWLIETLWKQVERLVKWNANRVATAINNSGRSCGVDFDDLCQVGFFAMLKAIENYKCAFGLFSAWFMFYLKTAFSEATGQRTEKDRREPMNSAISLDKPLSNDGEDAATFGDIVPDTKSAATMAAVEERIWHKQLCKAMEDVLSELPQEQQTALRHRYYSCRTYEGAAQQMGTTWEEVRRLEQGGIRSLRQSKRAKKLRPFYEVDCYSGTGLQAFRSSGMSVQERYLIRQERE